MKKKIWLILVACIALIAVLWFTGLIPKQIAKIAGTTYVNEHFPEMELEYKGVEWADVYGDYLISFEDKDGNKYSCVIGPTLFPTTLGQGLFAIEDYYSENYSVSSVGGVDGPQRVYSVVRLVNRESDKAESSYEVSANLPSTDFSSIGKTLEDKITAEWETYSGMTETQRLASSHLWELVGIQTDAWTECEEATGIAVDNPLEKMDWLNKTGYFGDESTDPTLPVKHIQISANAAQTATNIDGKLQQLSITAGYKTGTVKVTLSATLSSNVGAYTTGGVTNGYATFEEETLTTGSGIPVLVITADEENNNDYYNGDFYDPTAYWVKDNVFYAVRVFGDEADKEAIREVLEKILEEM